MLLLTELRKKQFYLETVSRTSRAFLSTEFMKLFRGPHWQIPRSRCTMQQTGFPSIKHLLSFSLQSYHNVRILIEQVNEIVQALTLRRRYKDIFCDITPCSPFKVNRCFGEIHELCLLTASCWFLAWLSFSTLKMEAMCPSEMSVDFQRTIRRFIPE
jgi:hypothetical protein